MYNQKNIYNPQGIPEKNTVSQFQNSLEQNLEPNNLFTVCNYLKINFHYFSMKRAIEFNKLEQITEKVQYLYQESQQFPHNSKIFADFLIKISCSSCQKHIPIISLECGHSFCSNCLDKITAGFLVPPTKFENPILCPNCRYIIKDTEFQMAYSDWHERKNQKIIRERKQTQGNLECKGCLRKLSLTSFVFCRCLCLECQLMQRTLGFCECGKFEYLITCDVCHKVEGVPYANEFAIFCDGHLHCKQCIAKCTDDFKCQVCQRSLDTCDIQKVMKYAFIQCDSCQMVYPEKWFLSRNCCKINVCLKCQTQNSITNCINCHTSIEALVQIALSFDS